MSERRAMSRAVRTARGAFGALTATMFAAISHALAGGTITPLGVAATALLALPLCVLLAGRVGSLWRLSLAVLAAQFLYHWSFSGLGMTGAAEVGAGASVSPHAAHLGAHAHALTPMLAASAADTWMWAAHALAALLTIALMHRGERAAMQLLRVLRSAVPTRIPAAVRLPAHPVILDIFTALPTRAAAVFLSAISHRGPPAALASAP